jgi:hypothetical protein
LYLDEGSGQKNAHLATFHHDVGDGKTRAAIRPDSYLLTDLASHHLAAEIVCAVFSELQRNWAPLWGRLSAGWRCLQHDCSTDHRQNLRSH